jgi:hypothetical protein
LAGQQFSEDLHQLIVIGQVDLSAKTVCKVKKMANRTSHRYNRLPLLPSGPGGVQQELVVPICQDKDTIDTEKW